MSAAHVCSGIFAYIMDAIPLTLESGVACPGFVSIILLAHRFSHKIDTCITYLVYICRS